MRRRVLLALFATGLLGAPLLAAGEGDATCCKKRQADAPKAAQASKLRCSLTGTVVESCCCVQREGKLHCTLAKKDVDSCCCKPPSKASEEEGEASKSAN
jgi:hypothetical protein